MSNPIPLTTLPDGTPNNTAHKIDSETVQITVELEAFGRGRKTDIYIIYTDDDVDPVRQIPSEWDPAASEPLSHATGTVWKNHDDLHVFKLPGETYDNLNQQSEWESYLLHHANGDIEAADKLAREHSPGTPEYTPNPDSDD